MLAFSEDSETNASEPLIYDKLGGGQKCKSATHLFSPTELIVFTDRAFNSKENGDKKSASKNKPKKQQGTV